MTAPVLKLQLSTSARPLHEDVLEFFQQRQASFGAMNLLSRHLPEPERVHELVRNVMTVDYSIGRAFDLPLYTDHIQSFAEYWGLSASPVTLLDSKRTNYLEHFKKISALDDQELGAAFRVAVSDSMDTFNLFTPKQCNLACRGCYAASVAVDRKPYDDAQVEGYFEGAKRIIAQARTLGAKTVYTSGDGEPTIFPKFFDLLEHISGLGMKWLFFTAGLSFSSERNAVLTWEQIRPYTAEHIARRIAADIEANEKRGEAKPVAKALLLELARHRDSIEIYHSMWSTDAQTNTSWRRPRLDDYEYVTVDVRGRPINVPSSLLDMMDVVFPGEHRANLGVEMPVSHVSVAQMSDIAAYVVDNGLKSYFEPAISTGHNKADNLARVAEQDRAILAPLMVRSLCSFRNLHQPTVKLWHKDGRSTFRVSPGMGVDMRDLDAAGVLDAMEIGDGDGGFFAAAHGPLIAHTNYAFVTGCKCNEFSQRFVNDRENLGREWREMAGIVDSSRLTPTNVEQALLAKA